MVKYDVNWVTGEKGNAFKEGDVLSIDVQGGYFFTAAIFENDGKTPVLIGYTKTKGVPHAEILVSRLGRTLKGKSYILKVRGFTKSYQGFGFSDEFDMV